MAINGLLLYFFGNKEKSESTSTFENERNFSDVFSSSEKCDQHHLSCLVNSGYCVNKNTRKEFVFVQSRSYCLTTSELNLT